MLMYSGLGRSAVLFAFFCCFLSSTGQAAERYAALVVEVTTGQVLFEENAQARRHPASLTKMMTLYMAFEALQRGRLTLKTPLRVSQRAATRPPTKLGVPAGGTITVEQAILALVTRSANDAATVLAEALGKSEYAFAQQMTKKAHALGMKNTQFRNASGLPDREQVTTAWDMYRLARALQTHFPQQYRYFSTRNFSFNGRNYRNHNQLLANYQGTDGIKTGYIRDSGFNLVASVQRGKHRLIGVVFGGQSASSRDKHMRTLLDQSFIQLNTGAPVLRIAEAEVARPAPDLKHQPRLTRQEAPIAQGSVEPPPIELIGVPTPPATPPQRTATMAAGSWGVQVGAFSQTAQAEKRTQEARRAVPKLLGNSPSLIDTLSSKGKTLYRVRFGGLNKAQAQNACKTLKQKKIDCIAVAPG